LEVGGGGTVTEEVDDNHAFGILLFKLVMPFGWRNELERKAFDEDDDSE
jgi:hypothetical protein